MAAAGVAVALFVAVSLLAGQAASVRTLWARVAVRVAGSWIVAIGLLMLGWANAQEVLYPNAQVDDKGEPFTGERNMSYILRRTRFHRWQRSGIWRCTITTISLWKTISVATASAAQPKG